MNPDDNQKNLLLAIVLSLMILLGWQYFFVSPKIKDEQARKAREQQVQTAAKPGSAPAATPTATPQSTTPPASTKPGATPPAATTAPPATAASIFATRADALKAGPRVTLETPNLKGSINLKGGRIDDLSLVQFRQAAAKDSPPVDLFSPSGAPEPYYAETGWIAAAGSTVKVPDAATAWRVESGEKLTPATPVVLAADDGLGHVFRRKISIDADFMLKIEDSVENKGQAPIVLDHRALLSRHGTPKVEGFYILHEGPIGVAGDKGLQEVTYANALKDLKSGEHKTSAFEKITGGWLGITDKYWAAALIPEQKATLDGYVTGYAKDARIPGSKESYQIDYLERGMTVAPGASRTVTTHLFAGAKKVKLIEAYEKSLDIKKFDLMIDWGWFYFITKPLFHLIDWIAAFFAKLGIVGNFGLAILATTVLVKGAFYPLANKSYESMAKMKKLQPEMERLRERYKDDPMKQRQELMEIYKKEKINPMAGCLPVLLQIPVFFALYKVLFVSIDMRHAPFYGWIHDLSAPDPTTLFNLFGLLSFTVPEFLHIGAWPIIMGITMWLQMQLNPQQPDPVQQQIFNWMPVVFTFMLGSFPVGLVMYWAWSNTLSLLQQYHINKKNGAEIHLWKNIGLERLLAGRSAKK
ncbi:MAG: membrane protein insertase YidC [Hyphomicrobiaceae bacterium]